MNEFCFYASTCFAFYMRFPGRWQTLRVMSPEIRLAFYCWCSLGFKRKFLIFIRLGIWRGKYILVIIMFGLFFMCIEGLMYSISSFGRHSVKQVKGSSEMMKHISRENDNFG